MVIFYIIINFALTKENLASMSLTFLKATAKIGSKDMTL